MSRYQKILTAVRRASGYPRHRWEVALCYEKTNINYPFRPEDYPQWDGSIEALSSHMKDIKDGVYLECWIYGREELEDNVYVRIISPTQAQYRICGNNPWREVSL